MDGTGDNKNQVIGAPKQLEPLKTKKYGFKRSEIQDVESHTEILKRV